MKKRPILFLLISFAIIAGLSSCGLEGEKTADSNTGNNETTGLSAVYQSYLTVKENLANDNPEEAKKNAEKLKQKIENSQIENKEALSGSASQIASTTDITAQRQSFATLSEQFVQVVKNNPDAVDKAYIQYCPMALNDQGAVWVSNTEEIRNPYMGQKMLECGSTKETIN